ncbi:MAG: YIP1 family protein [Candidatus Krumholzibacteriia bacterium]
MTEPSLASPDQSDLDPGSPSLGERVSDVFVAPVRAMRAVAVRPAWWLPALLAFLVVGLFTLANVQQLMTAQMEARLETATSQQAAAIEQQLEMFADPPVWLRVLTAVGAGLGVVVSGLIFALVCHLFLRLSEGQGRLGQSVGVVFWAGLIAYGLKTILGWIVLVATGSVRATGLTAAALLPDANQQSVGVVVANLLGDPFAWWMLAVIALGMAVCHRLQVSRAAVVIVATYLLLGAVMVGLTLIQQFVSGA